MKPVPRLYRPVEKTRIKAASMNPRRNVVEINFYESQGWARDYFEKFFKRAW